MNTENNQLQRAGVVLFDYFAEMYYSYYHIIILSYHIIQVN